jgi:hypothetical protein
MLLFLKALIEIPKLNGSPFRGALLGSLRPLLHATPPPLERQGVVILGNQSNSRLQFYVVTLWILLIG